MLTDNLCEQQSWAPASSEKIRKVNMQVSVHILQAVRESSTTTSSLYSLLMHMQRNEFVHGRLILLPAEPIAHRDPNRSSGDVGAHHHFVYAIRLTLVFLCVELCTPLP